MKAEDPPAALRVVIDTNVLISSLLIDTGVPGELMRQLAEMSAVLLFSDESFDELATRAARPKFDRYRTIEQLHRWLVGLSGSAQWLAPTERFDVCRDPDDNRFLELALSGEADAIISGDGDLLALHPFEGIPILTPADFLRQISPG